MKTLDTYTTITVRDIAEGDVVRLGNWPEGQRVESRPLVFGAYRLLKIGGTCYRVHGNDPALVLVRYEDTTI